MPSNAQNQSIAAANGESTIADQPQGNGCHRQENGVFPSAIGARKDPAIAEMHRRGRQHDRDQHQRDLPGVKANYQRDASQQLYCENRIGQEAGEANTLKELRGSRKGG